MIINKIDNIEEADTRKSVILAVSFGTSCKNSRTNAIGAVENAIAAEYTDYEVRRAFTSRVVINTIREKDGEEIDHIEQALDKLASDGVKRLVIQPTYIIYGNEYKKLADAVECYKNKFNAVSLGTPLLTDESDCIRLVNALEEEIEKYSDEETAIVFMGHGIEHALNTPYIKLQNAFRQIGRTNCFVGTIKSAPSLDDIVASVQEGGYKKVVLLPLLIAAGTHAKKEMAGSWKAVFEEKGFNVRCILKGFGEIKAIRDIYISLTQNAINKLNL